MSQKRIRQRKPAGINVRPTVELLQAIDRIKMAESRSSVSEVARVLMEDGLKLRKQEGRAA